MHRSFRYSEENAKGLVELLEGDETIARLTYSRIDDNNIIIDHTHTDPKVKGTGAGKAIVTEVVNWAREKNQKILPLCSFAKAQFERNETWQDVLRN